VCSKSKTRNKIRNWGSHPSTRTQTDRWVSLPKYSIISFYLKIVGIYQQNYSILAVSFLIGAGKEARIHPLEIFKLVDVGECFESRIELP